MLYANVHSTGFPKLANALKLSGLTESVINVAIEYLNPEKERDDTLLEKIPLQPYVQDWRIWDELEKAVKKEIRTDKTGELLNRYILLGHAIYGSDSARFIGTAFSTYNFDKSKWKIIENALSLRFGKKKTACLYAIYLNNRIGGYGYFADDYKATSDVCVDAVEFADRNPILVSVLCAMALNQCATPERHGFGAWFVSKTEKNAIVEKALGYIHDLIDKNSKPYPELIVASGEGAYFSDKCCEFFYRHINGSYEISAVKCALERIPDTSRIFDLIFQSRRGVSADLISYLAVNWSIRGDVKIFMKKTAEKYTDEYLKSMNSMTDICIAKTMADIFAEVFPKHAEKQDKLREKAQREISADMARAFDKQDRDDMRLYFLGKKTFDEILPILLKENKHNVYRLRVNYIQAYGMDDFMKRAVTAFSVTEVTGYYGARYTLMFDVDKNIEVFVDLLSEQINDGTIFLNAVARELVNSSWSFDTTFEKAYITAVKYAEKISGADTKDLSVCGRQLYVKSLAKADPEKYKDKIFSLAGDSSKKVREELADVISAHTEWREDIINLLGAKKIGMRELAVEVIKRQNTADYREELEKAFEKEKSEKIKIRISELNNMNYTSDGNNATKLSEADLVAGVAKGAKLKKVAWLFEQPYKTVHFADGGEVPENYLKALVILYSDMNAVGINRTAVDIAEKMNPDELGGFVLDVFGRWLEKGAPAKTKWVLWFCGVHGNSDMIKNFMHYIKEWSEHSRSAIAGEAVCALAMNGSSEALINVDAMARKFKNRQVRSSANKALLSVAEQLGITREELSDRIVPDMNFDENMCRVFDYGQRKFNVYLTPSLEIEIYNGDKKVKNMPKPSTKDDKEIAEKSYNDFKAMKKQIKAVIENQKNRLEYVLMCDRKWTAEAWRNLFVKNPVMHCFAVGLVWGIYNDGVLSESFRYMDDGSFTDIEGDEFEIPENAEIGLIHPVELTDEERKAWAEQLSDYEITQPFLQIGRPVYKPSDSELKDDEVGRFDGQEVSDYTLRGRLTKLGWETGTPEDAGYFMEFVRCDDITVSESYRAEIEFSGMCIDFMQNDMMTLGNLFFYRGDTNKKLKIKDVSPRYFSEIIMQISSFAVKEEQ